jgi:Rrf2 family protein
MPEQGSGNSCAILTPWAAPGGPGGPGIHSHPMTGRIRPVGLKKPANYKYIVYETRDIRDGYGGVLVFMVSPSYRALRRLPGCIGRTPPEARHTPLGMCQNNTEAGGECPRRPEILFRSGDNRTGASHRVETRIPRTIRPLPSFTRHRPACNDGEVAAPSQSDAARAALPKEHAIMRISRSTGMAIDGLFYMSVHPDQTHFYVDEIAAVQKVSATYLAKVFQQLARNGILRSQRGSKGGYAFGRTPKEISLFDIVAVCEGDLRLFDCGGDQRSCDLQEECLVCRTFSEAEGLMRQALQGVSVADLRDYHKNNGGLPGWVSSSTATSDPA